MGRCQIHVDKGYGNKKSTKWKETVQVYLVEISRDSYSFIFVIIDTLVN